MQRNEVEELRYRVACAAVLEKSGFAIDVKVSTRRAVKYRRGDAVIIVIHEGRGWFDPFSDAKGDVYTLVAHLDGVGFAECLDRVAELTRLCRKRIEIGDLFGDDRLGPTRFGPHDQASRSDRQRPALPAASTSATYFAGDWKK
ncbi:hypothetical protein [Bosea sp. Root483D1]|uniref:hypothetical protein n=1 Tax=Bosea sp. Root483D1 TaxID=1736544 RepID=UPI000AFF0A2F